MGLLFEKQLDLVLGSKDAHRPYIPPQTPSLKPPQISLVPEASIKRKKKNRQNLTAPIIPTGNNTSSGLKIKHD
jgi:hypothetical protein